MMMMNNKNTFRKNTHTTHTHTNKQRKNLKQGKMILEILLYNSIDMYQ